MAREPKGRSLPLSLPRRFVSDLVHFAQKVPNVTTQRRLALGELAAARQQSQPRPSWVAIFLKAYGQVAAKYPELRRAYLPCPWPRLYEHPRSVAAVTIERRLGDEDAIFIAPFHEPENKSLHELDFQLRFFKNEPLEKLGPFRRVLWLSSLPRPLRRLLWWLRLNVSGPERAQFPGTFGFSTVSSLGTSIQNILSPLTTTLTYDTFAADGSVDVRLTFDHRVMDAATVARALHDLEEVLLGNIVAELRSLGARLAA